MRALIIDDDPQSVKLMKRALRGWETATAPTLTEGLAAAGTLKPPVIVLDVRFIGADLTGLDYLPRLAAVSPQSKIVVVTADYSPRDAELALENDAVISYAPKGDVALLISLALAAHRAAYRPASIAKESP